MKERVVSLGILVFAMIYLAGSISLKVGTLEQPGPGFLPAAVAALLLLAASFNAYHSFYRLPQNEKRETWFKPAPLGIALVTIAYPFILRPLSYLITTFIVLFVMLRLLRFKSIAISFITSLLTTVISFVVFAKALGVVLPSGFLEDIILRL